MSTRYLTRLFRAIAHLHWRMSWKWCMQTGPLYFVPAGERIFFRKTFVTVKLTFPFSQQSAFRARMHDVVLSTTMLVSISATTCQASSWRRGQAWPFNFALLVLESELLRVGNVSGNWHGVLGYLGDFASIRPISILKLFAIWTIVSVLRMCW